MHSRTKQPRETEVVFFFSPNQQFSTKQIRALRDREDASQSLFASYLNVTKGSVSKWEPGEKKPAGPSLTLLSLVKRKALAGIASILNGSPPTLFRKRS